MSPGSEMWFVAEREEKPCCHIRAQPWAAWREPLSSGGESKAQAGSGPSYRAGKVAQSWTHSRVAGKPAPFPLYLVGLPRKVTFQMRI